GNRHWIVRQDNTTKPQLLGQITITTSTGSLQFTSTYPVGGPANIDITTTALPLVGGASQTLDQLVAASRTATVGVSSGEVVPGPIVGAGLPGLVAACGALLAFARRRRRQQVA